MAESLMSLFVRPDSEEDNGVQISSVSEGEESVEIPIETTSNETDNQSSTDDSSFETEERRRPPKSVEESDPGYAFVDVSESDISIEHRDNEKRRPSFVNRRKSALLNLFQADPQADDSEEDINGREKYTFTNTVVGSYRDELAQELQREVQERKLLQKQKIEDGARNNPGAYIEKRHLRHTACFRRILMRIQHKIRQKHNILIYLAIMGILTGLTGFGMDLVIKLLELGHKEITYSTNIWPVQFFLWTLYLYVVLGFGVIAVRYISLNAIGSGIPEMKSILSGVTLVEYLSFRTLIAKMIGLTCAIGSGMVVGKEGPFVHTASIIANQLFRLPFFARIRNSAPLRQQMFTCAIAAGVAGNFGAPIGGLLFSIEVTSTYYPVRNYFFSAWAATFSGFTFRFLWNVRFSQPLFSAIAATSFTKEAEGSSGIPDVLGSFFLGIVGGLIGIIFIFVHLSIIRLRRKGAQHYWIFRSPYPYTIVVAGITALLLFPLLIGEYMELLPVASFTALTTVGPLSPEWLVISIWVSIPLFVLSRFWLAALSISLPIPCGLFVPTIVVGAGIGRLVGETIALMDDTFDPTGELPGIMAVVGAAAAGAGVTQTFSVAMILFELTGQIILLVPITIAVIIAIATSRTFSYNIYDGILKSRNLPYLPDIRTRGQSMRAVDVMDTSVVANNWFLTRKTTLKRLERLMGATSHLSSVAVVDSDETPTLLGVVTRTTLEEIRNNAYAEIHNINGIPQQEHTWHGDVTKNIMTVTKAFNPFMTDDSPPTAVPPQTFQFEDSDELDREEITIPYEYSPVQLQPSTPLTSIHLLFITLRLQNAYVTINGRLMGVITRNHIKELIHDTSVFEWLQH